MNEVIKTIPTTTRDLDGLKPAKTFSELGQLLFEF